MAPPSPPRIRPRRLKQAKAPAVSQCDSCEVWKCSKRDLMARDELLAETNNQPRPECEDYEPGYWERMAI